MNDGSTDGSLDEIRRFKSDKLTVVDQVNMGAAASRNNAFERSTGLFIQWLDADDLISRDKIEQQLLRLDGHPNCIASAEWGRFSGKASSVTIDSGVVRCDMSAADWLLSPASSMKFPGIWLIPRGLVERAGPWNERLTLADDHEYFSRVIAKADKVLFTERATAFYRSGISGSLSGRKSAKSWKSAYEANVLHAHHLLAVEDSPRSRRRLAEDWLGFAKAVYPYDAFLGEAAITAASWMDPMTPFPTDGGLAFRAISRVCGWRFARRLQVAIGRS